MNKDKLITKQQLEIEELKSEISMFQEAIQDARSHLWKPEQWSTKCPDFPKVAMSGIVQARRALDGL